MPIELHHPEDEVDTGSLAPTTRDPDTPPSRYAYLTFEDMPLTFRGRKLMIRIDDE